MEIALDFSAGMTQGAGVARYSRELARALIALGHAEDRYRLAYASARPLPVPPETAPARLARIPLPDRLWRLWLLLTHLQLAPPADPLVQPCDLYHGLNWVAPRFRRVPTVVTVHDTSYLTHPEYHTAGTRLYLTLASRWSARAARRVIADSEATAADVVRWLGVPRGRVRVVYPGVDERFQPLESARELARARYALDGPYLLGVGTLEPRKNVGALVAAFEALAGERADLLLALAGASGWRDAELRSVIRRSPFAERIRVLGRVPDADLPALYSAASAFVYPSRYEGFGLPPLEAMACGAPVVTSNVSSLPEVVGDAALLVDPADPRALAGAVRRILDDAALAAELRRRGRARAAGFTWSRTARETRAIYASVATER